MANPTGGRRVDEDAILRRLPREEGDLFRGASAWGADLPGWRRSARETLSDGPGQRLIRTIWDREAVRVMVDVVECASAATAVRALLERLVWNQLAELPAGPANLGIASFVHPEGVPPAVFYARANLCVTVASFAREPAAVLPVALALDRRLAAEPQAGGAALRVDAERLPGGAFAIRVTLPFQLAEEGHLRYRARGGTLEIRDDRVVVAPAGGREVEIEVFAEEAGRAASAGRVNLPG